jgi:hypothetical protein
MQIEEERENEKRNPHECRCPGSGAALGLRCAARERSANLGNAMVVSTVPSNGDVNPYGVAFVPREFPTGGNSNPETSWFPISTIR